MIISRFPIKNEKHHNLITLLLTCGLTKAQSNREDIEIDWPKADGWVLDKSLSFKPILPIVIKNGYEV